jgi:hypothetical protein
MMVGGAMWVKACDTRTRTRTATHNSPNASAMGDRHVLEVQTNIMVISLRPEDMTPQDFFSDDTPIIFQYDSNERIIRIISNTVAICRAVAYKQCPTSMAGPRRLSLWSLGFNGEDTH